MLINEILNPSNPQITKGKFDFNSLGSRIGGGAFADVYKSKEGNSVIKVVSMRDFNNSYLNFIQIVEKNQNNPFFPKIHSVKIYEREGKKFYPYLLVVEMEKLAPSVNNNLLDQLGLPADFKNVFKDFKTSSGRETLISESKNPQFQAAMRALEPLFKSHNPDFKSENMMIRGTGDNSQLVITDPVH